MSNVPALKRTFYRVWFDDPSEIRCHTDLPRERGIDFVSRGFWVNDALEYTGALSDRNWIPPSRIVLVTVMEAAEPSSGEQT